MARCRRCGNRTAWVESGITPGRRIELDPTPRTFPTLITALSIFVVIDGKALFVPSLSAADESYTYYQMHFRKCPALSPWDRCISAGKQPRFDIDH